MLSELSSQVLCGLLARCFRSLRLFKMEFLKHLSGRSRDVTSVNLAETLSRLGVAEVERRVWFVNLASKAAI